MIDIVRSSDAERTTNMRVYISLCVLYPVCENPPQLYWLQKGPYHSARMSAENRPQTSNYYPPCAICKTPQPAPPSDQKQSAKSPSDA